MENYTDTGNIGHKTQRRQTKQTIQHRKIKRSATGTTPKTEDEHRFS